MELIICGRPDLGEEYLCELLDVGQHGHAGTVNPIVRVLAILRYPRQRAIYWPDVVNEVPPVRGGCICRLPRVRAATEAEAGRYASWEESAEILQWEYLAVCPDPAEREIIQRHMAGEYAPRRTVRTYKQYELAAAQAAWEKVRHD